VLLPPQEIGAIANVKIETVRNGKLIGAMA